MYLNPSLHLDCPVHSLVTLLSELPGLFKTNCSCSTNYIPVTPLNNLNSNFLWVKWRPGVGVGDVLCTFTASAKPAFFSAVTHKVKMPTMATRCTFLQVISKMGAVCLSLSLSLSHSLSIPFVTDYSSSFPGAAIVARNSCTAQAQTQTPSAV
jgi:hypothetical protein